MMMMPMPPMASSVGLQPPLASTSAPPPSAPPAIIPTWTEHRAPDGRPYWACAATGRRSWSKPAELIAAGSAGVAGGTAGAGADAEAAARKIEAARKVEALVEGRTRWRQFQRPSDGRAYFSHLDSRETRWSAPEELERVRREAREEVEMEEVRARAKEAAARALAAAASAAGAAAPATAPSVVGAATTSGAGAPAVAVPGGGGDAAKKAAATAITSKAAAAAAAAAAVAAAPPPLPGAAEAAKRLAKRKAEGHDHMYDTKAEAVEAFFALLTGELGLGVSGVWEEFFFLARRRF